MFTVVVDAVWLHQPGYGGIAVLYGNQLRFSEVTLPPTTLFEALCMRFRVGNSSWLLMMIYRPGILSSHCYVSDELSAVLETPVSYGCPIVIGGDFNIHVENPSDVNASYLMELLSCVDLQQHVTLPTHQAGGTLDLVITFSDYDVDQLTVDPPGVVSDHSLIMCCLPVRRVAASQFTRKVRSWQTIVRRVMFQAIADSPLGREPSSDKLTV